MSFLLHRNNAEQMFFLQLCNSQIQKHHICEPMYLANNSANRRFLPYTEIINAEKIRVNNSSPLKRFAPLRVTNNFAECFSTQTCSSHKSTVNIRHCHQLGYVSRFDATSIQYSDGFGKSVSKIFFNQRTQKTDEPPEPDRWLPFCRFR